MNTNRALTRAVAAKMSQTPLALSIGSTSENQNKKRSREDLDKTGEQVETFDSFLLQIKQMINEGNARIEQKIEASNNALLQEISTLREEVHQLKADYARDLNRLNDSNARLEFELHKTRDSVNRLSKSNDLILTGVPYNATENTGAIIQKVAVALGYCDTDAPLVYTKRLARAPIIAGATPPILIQFAFKVARDEFFRRYFVKRDLNLTQLGFEVNKRIYMNENLTELARHIKGIALKLKHRGKIRTVYSKDGTVFVKQTEDTPALPIYYVDQLAKFGLEKTLDNC